MVIPGSKLLVNRVGKFLKALQKSLGEGGTGHIFMWENLIKHLLVFPYGKFSLKLFGVDISKEHLESHACSEILFCF